MLSNTPSKTGEPVNITPVLGILANSDVADLEQLIPLVHRKLHKIAEGLLYGENPGLDLQPTILINEFIMKLLSKGRISYTDSEHFFSAAVRIMRLIIIDFARTRNRAKRGGEVKLVTLDEELNVGANQNVKLTALYDALEALYKVHPRAARVIDFHCFFGASADEIAPLLKVSPETVRRDLRWARAWLYKEIFPEKTDVLYQSIP